MNLDQFREWIRQHQSDADDDAARALLALLASQTDRFERRTLRKALESIGKNVSGCEPLAAAYARGVLEELRNAG